MCNFILFNVKNAIVLVFIILSVTTIAQTKKHLPPGTVKVEENLFLDKTEIFSDTSSGVSQ